MQREKYNHKGKAPFALFSMVLGGLLMVVLVISFNKSVEKREVVEKNPLRQIKTEKKQQTTEKPKPKPNPKPKQATPKAPMPDLGAMLNGVAMNIPEFATTDIVGDSTSLLEDIAEDAVMSEGAVDSKPRVESRVAIEYPEGANGAKGYVTVNLLIAKDGTVEIAKILESQPPEVFDAVVLNGVRSWRFSPAKYKGKPVKVWAKQKVRFN